MRRRRIKQTTPLEERLAREAKHLRENAARQPPGIKRENLLRKARQCETGAHMSEWLRSPGLQPPKSPAHDNLQWANLPATKQRSEAD